jgi:ADP-ribose pyrophosphatase YjhB (NUDIX family)
MNTQLSTRAWRTANDQPVVYDGSPVQWRISCYGVVVQDDQILVMQDKNNYLFTVPGGGVELPETLEEGLAREMQEEIGATVKVGELISSTEDWFYHAQEKRFYHAVLLFYQAELSSELGVPSDPKVTFAGFMPITSLTAENTNPLVWEVLQSFI